MTSLQSILTEFREAKRSNREMGDQFERLFKVYLENEPVYQERFSKVWLWSEWPDRSGPDTGIDLVAEESNGTGLCAIQCKFYDPSYSLQKSDIDSFFTASGKAGFSSRIIVSTTDHWSPHAEAALENQAVPVTRINVHDMGDSVIDWSKFSLKNPQHVEVKAKNQLRHHQQEALDAVMQGFTENERGKLIMACGTGKTFTSLKIAEAVARQQEDRSGRILFLVPSIALLNQTLSEWTQNTELSLMPFAVCSDTKVGKKAASSDTPEISVSDLPINATTNPNRLIDAMKKFAGKYDPQKPGMTVVFSTYQSIEVIAKAQELGLEPFDLVICDEAHRTTGVTLVDEDESAFVRVHDNSFLKGNRRLYMTATPRIYEEGSKKEAEEGGAIVASMDDVNVYGPEFFHLGFGRAVEDGLLTDYKVLVLAVDEKFVSKAFQSQLSVDGELNLDDVVKITGCWNGLSKRSMASDDPEVLSEFEDGLPMQRAVAFARSIKDSKALARQFEAVVDANIREVQAQQEEMEDEEVQDTEEFLRCEVEHVDGTMNALERGRLLEWLKAPLEDKTCRILSNARCLSEGVDVPSLDAVMFLNPRNSVVDVVQSVGRVMRRAPGKKYGYIILPIGIPADKDPEEALKDNKKYKVVWQVLQALRAHDDRFNATVNQIELNRKKPDNISIIGVGAPKDDNESDSSGDSKPKGEGKGTGKGNVFQPMLDFDMGQWRDAIFARIVKKVGDRRYWESWASDVADIAERHIMRINTILETDAEAKKAFDEFLEGLHENINDGITQSDAVEMLAQHLITKPVFDALFEDFNFTDHNPVSQAMQGILTELEKNALEREQESLEAFYASVRRRAEGIDNAAGKQKVVLELYDTFFRSAFPRTAERLGIVYTPVEVVDFIINSVEHVLQKHFGTSISDSGVQVLDPFTGTGTFMVRLLQSGLIKPEDLKQKYLTELHANEIVLLAYYIAAVNIEATFFDLAGEYQPFEGIVMTDTFEEKGDLTDLVFEGNNKRIKRQKQQDIRVIIGNPPYSAGQNSQNDNNQNQKYPALDKRIEQTYAAQSTAVLKNSLYDSYIRGIRWASDRVKDKGIVAFVTNGSFIDSNSADGLRKSLYDEFAHLYVFNLRGNQRTSGETSRREGGKIFGSGSRTPVAITVMIKDASHEGPCELHYHDIGDYLSREEKLHIIEEFGSVADMPFKDITPNEHGDWVGQRSEEFGKFLQIGTKNNQEETLFVRYSRGVGTGRDAWVVNSSVANLSSNVSATIEFYNSQVRDFESKNAGLTVTQSKKKALIDKFIDTDSRRISWTRGLKEDLGRGKYFDFSEESIRTVVYRPYFKQNLYFGRNFNDAVNLLPYIFTDSGGENLAIQVTGVGSNKGFSALIVDTLPDLELISKGQVFPLYTYEQASEGSLFSGDSNGYQRKDNISDAMLTKFREQYGDQSITKEDIFYYVYGLLHSPEYREKYEDDLKKMLPRIPFAPDFWAFSKAGRELGQLHVGYEKLEPWPLTIQKHKLVEGDDFYHVKQMKHPGKRGNLDLSTIEYNANITISGIPAEAHEYIVNGKSALAWVMERYAVKVDKASGIRNDPNDWATEHNDPEYILRLVGQVARVSVETVRIVKGLPGLEG